jgi:hypothetical protein
MGAVIGKSLLIFGAACPDSIGSYLLQVLITAYGVYNRRQGCSGLSAAIRQPLGNNKFSQHLKIVAAKVYCNH